MSTGNSGHEEWKKSEEKIKIYKTQINSLTEQQNAINTTISELKLNNNIENFTVQDILNKVETWLNLEEDITDLKNKINYEKKTQPKWDPSAIMR